jgi:hypothetical protein
LTDENATTLLHEARGKSRRQIEELIARWFPRSDVPPSLTPIAPAVSVAAGAEQLRLGATPRTDVRATCPKTPKTGEGALARLEPLSPTRLRVEFTTRAELYEKLEKAARALEPRFPPKSFRRSALALRAKTRRQLSAKRSPASLVSTSSTSCEGVCCC